MEQSQLLERESQSDSVSTAEMKQNFLCLSFLSWAWQTGPHKEGWQEDKGAFNHQGGGHSKTHNQVHKM